SQGLVGVSNDPTCTFRKGRKPKYPRETQYRRTQVLVAQPELCDTTAVRMNFRLFDPSSIAAGPSTPRV
ncbi:hypothetical protein NHX12_010741, partial [Muraenolepis orangiensis]